MIDGDCVNSNKLSEVIFVRGVVAVPRDNIKRRMILSGGEEFALIFIDYCVLNSVDVLEPSLTQFNVVKIMVETIIITVMIVVIRIK